MNATDFPLAPYLERIGLSGPPNPDEDGLKKLHAAQAFSMPFENFDIHLGRIISLRPEDLLAKMIYHRRGGYCFELNSLLRMGLKALGFSARPLIARVLYGRTDPGARTHQVLIVTISGRDWLADCGFGGPGLRLPLPKIEGRVEEQFGERYRLQGDPRYGMVLQKEVKNAFTDLYVFNEGERMQECMHCARSHAGPPLPQVCFWSASAIQGMRHRDRSYRRSVFDSIDSISAKDKDESTYIGFIQ